MTNRQQESRLFSKFRTDPEAINSIVLQEWGLVLDSLIKASQNHTYSAHNPQTQEKYIVRATHIPDDEISNIKHGRNSVEQRIADELFFISYVSKKGLEGVCTPVTRKLNGTTILSLPSNLYIQFDNLIICVFNWAKGHSIDFMALKWLTDEKIVYAQGQWLAVLHSISMDFSTEYYAIALRIRRWNELHSGVLKGVKISNEDKFALGARPHTSNVGVIHGDLNVSNFFLRPSDEVGINEQSSNSIKLSVFDWDQVQWAWFEYDIAQCMVACLMLAEAGLPPTNDPVLSANVARYEQQIVAGYESVRGAGSVDRDRLARMLRLKKIFYCRFCRRAAAEGDMPEDMAWFIHYVNRWMITFPISEEELGTESDECKDDEYRGIFEVSCERQPDLQLSFGTHSDQVCDIYHAAGGRPPLGPLLLIHGGYWRPEYDRGHLRPLAVYLASIGWEVALTEYRRIPGQPDLMIQDVKASSDKVHEYFIQEVLGGDGTGFGGVTAVGHSAGGHLALLCLGRTNGRNSFQSSPPFTTVGTDTCSSPPTTTTTTTTLRAVVALAPVADLKAAEDLQLDDQAVVAFLGPCVAASQRQDLDPSLLNYGKNTPIFVIHGCKDIRVPVEMSRYVTKKLKDAGERIEYVELDNVGHFELIDSSFGAVREALSAGLHFAFT